MLNDGIQEKISRKDNKNKMWFSLCYSVTVECVGGIIILFNHQKKLPSNLHPSCFNLVDIALYSFNTILVFQQFSMTAQTTNYVTLNSNKNLLWQSKL